MKVIAIVILLLLGCNENKAEDSLNSENHMNVEKFWAIVQVEPAPQARELLNARLQKLTAGEIVQFQKHFDHFFVNAYTHDLWGAAYLTGGGCSNDGFIDFRYGLIAHGKNVYENALENPDSLADLGPSIDVDNEGLGYVASEIYETRNAGAIPKSMEHPNLPSGTAWNFEDTTIVQQKFPRLSDLMKQVWDRRLGR